MFFDSASPPTGWTLSRLKDVARLNTEVLSETTDPSLEIQYVDIGNVSSDGRVVNTEVLAFADAPTRARRLVRAGDTIISTVRAYLRAVAHLPNPPSNLVVSTGFAVLRPLPVVHPAYLGWLVRSDPFIGAIMARSQGVSYPAIAPQELSSLPLWFPPIAQQRAIAAYLDSETSAIDAVLARTVRLTSLLQERERSETRQVVLSGLSRARVETRLPWQPLVPATWRTTKLPFLADIAGGLTPDRSTDAYWNGATPWVSAKDMKSPVIRTSEDMVTAEALGSTGLRLHEPPVVLMVVRGMILAHALPVAVTSVPVTINQDLKALRPRRSCDADYLRNLLSAVAPAILSLLVEEAAHGTKALRTDRLKELALFLPPVPEQQAINAYVHEANQRIARLVSSMDTQVGLLRQRSAALVTAAVTGQLDPTAAA